MLSFRQIILRLRKVPRLAWRGLVLGVFALISAVAWWYPVSHQWLTVQLGLAVSPPQAIAADMPTAALVDRVTALEQKVAEAEATVQADKTQMDSLVSQFQQATTEVATTNSQLEKQTQQIQSLLAAQGGATGSSSAVSSSEAVGTSSGEPSTTSVPGKVSINTASLTELETLPGIGATYAQRIIDYRTKNGGFKTIDELQNVSGIGPATFAKLKDLVEL